MRKKKLAVFFTALLILISFVFLALLDNQPQIKAENYSVALNYLPHVNYIGDTTPTSTPLPTPTNTSTPTNTPTPTSTPTATPDPVVILPNHSSYTNIFDDLHVAGEVKNNGSDYLRSVKISVNVFDALGNLLATDFSYIRLHNLPPGEKTCFDLFVKEPVGWSSYEFEDVSYQTGGEPTPNLSILNHSSSYDPGLGRFQIIGQVRNNETKIVEFVRAVGTLYDSTNTTIDCGYDTVNSRDLNPGQISSFEIGYVGRDYADVASYRLQADGRIQ